MPWTEAPGGLKSMTSLADHVTAHISKLVIHLSAFRRNNVPIQCSRWTEVNVVSFRLLKLPKFLIT